MREAVICTVIGTVIGMGVGAVAVAYCAPRLFDWIIKKGLGS